MRNVQKSFYWHFCTFCWKLITHRRKVLERQIEESHCCVRNVGWGSNESISDQERVRAQGKLPKCNDTKMPKALKFVRKTCCRIVAFAFNGSKSKTYTNLKQNTENLMNESKLIACSLGVNIMNFIIRELPWNCLGNTDWLQTNLLWIQNQNRMK